jgi:hypothetical protein
MSIGGPCQGAGVRALLTKLQADSDANRSTGRNTAGGASAK